MSLSALLTAVRNTLRTDLSLADIVCQIMQDGQPPPSWSGDQFVAVHALSWDPAGPTDRGLDEYFGIGVTISRRLPYPQDRIPEKVYLTALTGLEAISRTVVIAIHQSYVVLNAANVILDNTSFVETLVWAGTDPTPSVHTGEYLFSDNPQHVNQLAALSMTVRFQKARKIQTYAGMA